MVTVVFELIIGVIAIDLVVHHAKMLPVIEFHGLWVKNGKVWKERHVFEM